MPKEITSSQALRILKINSCPSLSGRSELTYHVGCNDEGEIQFRVVSNSGSGQFNADVVSLSQIRELFSEYPEETPMTSTVLCPVFRGKSRNSAAFLFAALRAESIVLPRAGKDAGYLVGDIEAFTQAMNILIATDAPFPVAMADKPTKKKPVGRKPSGAVSV